jgi:predicted metalloendopeptidase
VTEEQLNDVGCFLEELFLLGRCDLVRYLTIAGKPKRDHVMDYLICYKIYLHEINAYSLVSQNGLFVSLAYLLPPFDLRGDSEAETFASLITVGHEMTHLLDAVGSTYNEHGMKEDWWTAADKAAFDERCKLLIDCYSSMEVAPTLMPGVYCDGEKTLSENIADLGGFNVLLDVYTEHLQQQGFRGEDLKAQQRKFFESSADRYRASLSEDGLKVFLDDVHAPYRERVNGVVRNNDLWYELYDVTPDNKLFLPAEKRVRIW